MIQCVIVQCESWESCAVHCTIVYIYVSFFDCGQTDGLVVSLFGVSLQCIRMKTL